MAEEGGEDVTSATTVASDASYNLPWDAFLEGKVERLMTERFRQAEWPVIVRHLRKDHDLVVADGLEPHWVGPGRAVLWQEQHARNGDSTGWTPMTPQRVGSAAELARHLRKGLRLRPPESGVDVEALEAHALPPEVAQGDQEELPTYSCGNRHPSGSGRVGKAKQFQSWRHYVKHCLYYNDPITEMPPDTVRASLASKPYVCIMCAKGFASGRAATNHYKSEIGRLRMREHVTVEQMQVAAKTLQNIKTTV